MTYSALPGALGEDQFSITVTDGVNEDTVPVTVTVMPDNVYCMVPDNPDRIEIRSGLITPFTLACNFESGRDAPITFDPEPVVGDEGVVTIEAGEEPGSYVAHAANLAQYYGDETTVTFSIGSAWNPTPAEVEVRIYVDVYVNHAPTCVAEDPGTVAPQSTIDLVIVCTDPENDPIASVEAAPPDSGTIEGDAQDLGNNRFALKYTAPAEPGIDRLYVAVQDEYVHGAGMSSVEVLLNIGEPQDTAPPDTYFGQTPTAFSPFDYGQFQIDSTEADSTFECKLDNGPWLACNGTPTVSFDDLGDGEHTLLARATDVVGNTDPTPVSHTWIVDTEAPDTTITNAPESPSRIHNPEYSFASTEDEATYECRLFDEDWFDCSSPIQIDDLNEDGSLIFQVRSIDRAGNVDMSAAEASTVLDWSRPETGIASGPFGTVSSPTATFHFTATEEDVTYLCNLDEAEEYTPCGGDHITYSDLADGEHRFIVLAVDAAGNESVHPGLREWVVDRSASNAIAAEDVTPRQVVSMPAPTPTLPISVSIDPAVAGNITVQVQAAPQTPTPSGYVLLGTELVVSAPAADHPDAPLRLTFDLDPSAIPSGVNTDDVRVVRNGTPVTTQCQGDAAIPSPCVRTRTSLPGGALRIVIHTMEASTWVFARATAAVTPDPDPTPNPNPNPTPDPNPNPNPTPEVEQPPVAERVATKLAAASMKVVKFRCRTRAERASGVSLRGVRWCWRLEAAARLVTRAGTPVAGHTLTFQRRVGSKSILIAKVRTNAKGVARINKTVVVPASSRRSLTRATAWMRTQYASGRITHAPRGTTHGAAPTKALPIRH